MNKPLVFMVVAFTAALMVAGCMQNGSPQTSQPTLQTATLTVSTSSAPVTHPVQTTGVSSMPVSDPILGKWLVVNATGVSGNADFLSDGTGNIQITKDFIPLGSGFKWANSGDNIHYNATLAANGETIDLTLLNNQLVSSVLPAGAYLEKETG